MKQTNKLIPSLPQRLSNATLSDEGASVDLSQLDKNTKIAAVVGWSQSRDQSSHNPASRQPQRERARRALIALFPDGPPDAATLSNKALAKIVNEWLESQGQAPVNQRTIQRAAGRP
jgi:hypothetical protein